MKGFAVSVFWTTVEIVVVIAALLIIGALLICVLFPFCPFGPAHVTYALNYVDVSNTPYAIASILSQYDVTKSGGNGKTLIDYAYETMLTGSISAQDKEMLSANLKELLDKYNLNYYEISIKTAKNEQLVQFGSTITKCGPNLEGACAANPGPYDGNGNYIGKCDVGRTEINKVDEGQNKCGFGLLCCAQTTEIEYFKWLDTQEKKIPNTEKMKVIKCGDSDAGICSGNACGQSEVTLDGNCKVVNNGKTPYCCSTNSDTLRNEGKIADAEIPLFYGGKDGTLVVTTSG